MCVSFFDAKIDRFFGETPGRMAVVGVLTHLEDSLVVKVAGCQQGAAPVLRRHRHPNPKGLANSELCSKLHALMGKM